MLLREVHGGTKTIWIFKKLDDVHRNKEVQESTHNSSNTSVHNAKAKQRERKREKDREREGEKRSLDNEWPALYHRCITVWCGTEQWHSSHSTKTPCCFISCLLNEPSLVRVLKGLCLVGLNYALSPPLSQRSDLNLHILVPTCSLWEYLGWAGRARLRESGSAALLSQQAWPAFGTPHPLAQAI